MGAGCYYTHRCNKAIAYWVDIPESFKKDSETPFDCLFEDLANILEDLGYSNENRNLFGNGLFIIELESTYYGEGIILQINPRHSEWAKEYNLAMANHEIVEKRIAKTINQYYPLRYATSGYTAATIEKGHLK